MVYHILHMLDDILIKLNWSASLHCTFCNQMTVGVWLHQEREILFLRICHNLRHNMYNTKFSLWSFHQLKCLILVHWSLVNKLIYRSATGTTYRRTQLLSKHLHGQDLPTLNLLGSFSTGICIISEWQAPLANKPAPFFIAEFQVTAVH